MKSKEEEKNTIESIEIISDGRIISFFDFMKFRTLNRYIQRFLTFHGLTHHKLSKPLSAIERSHTFYCAEHSVIHNI